MGREDINLQLWETETGSCELAKRKKDTSLVGVGGGVHSWGVEKNELVLILFVWSR